MNSCLAHAFFGFGEWLRFWRDSTIISSVPSKLNFNFYMTSSLIYGTFYCSIIYGIQTSSSALPLKWLPMLEVLVSWATWRYLFLSIDCWRAWAASWTLNLSRPLFESDYSSLSLILGALLLFLSGERLPFSSIFLVRMMCFSISSCWCSGTFCDRSLLLPDAFCYAAR